jgi:hypothetical protein
MSGVRRRGKKNPPSADASEATEGALKATPEVDRALEGESAEGKGEVLAQLDAQLAALQAQQDKIKTMQDRTRKEKYKVCGGS